MHRGHDGMDLHGSNGRLNSIGHTFHEHQYERRTTICSIQSLFTDIYLQFVKNLYVLTLAKCWLQMKGKFSARSHERIDLRCNDESMQTCYTLNSLHTNTSIPHDTGVLGRIGRTVCC